MKKTRQIQSISELKFGTKIQAVARPDLTGAVIPYVWNVTQQTTAGYFFSLGPRPITGTIIAQIYYKSGKRFIVIDTPTGIVIIEVAKFLIRLLPLLTLLIEKIKDLFKSLRPIPEVVDFTFFAKHQATESNFDDGYLYTNENKEGYYMVINNDLRRSI